MIDATGTPPDVTANAPLRDGWVDLADGGMLTVRHPKSLRESRFLGPGEVFPCVQKAELHELLQGSYVSAPGSGESPGHEAWIVTPLGVVRYGVAGLTVQLDKSAKAGKTSVETVKVASGTARVWHPHAVTASLDKYSATKLDGGAYGAIASYEWTFLRDGATFALSSPNAPRGAAADDAGATADIVAECLADAHLAADRARDLHPGTPDFGARAAAHLQVFDATRAACAVAKLLAPERIAELDRAIVEGETGDQTP